MARQIAETAEQRIEQFKRWYSATGHWAYDGRADALATWVRWGINTLPSAPASAANDLAQWVADDFRLPAAPQELLNARAVKALGRRFDDRAAITGFGAIEGGSAGNRVPA